MAVGTSISSTGALPVFDQTQRVSDLQQADATQATNLNQYTAGQQALQGNLAPAANNILTGNVSQSFGLPQVVYDAAFANWNQYEAPKLAAAYGAGSPAIGASAQNLNLQLSAMGAQNAQQNALGAFQAASNYAFTPIGNSQNQMSGRQQQENTTQQSMGLDSGATLSAILSLLGFSPTTTTGGGGGAGTSPGTFPP